MIVRLRFVYGETKKMRDVSPPCQFPSTRRRGREKSLKGGGWGSPGRRPNDREAAVAERRFSSTVRQGRIAPRRQESGARKSTRLR